MDKIQLHREQEGRHTWVALRVHFVDPSPYALDVFGKSYMRSFFSISAWMSIDVVISEAAEHVRASKHTDTLYLYGLVDARTYLAS